MHVPLEPGNRSGGVTGYDTSMGLDRVGDFRLTGDNRHRPTGSDREGLLDYRFQEPNLSLVPVDVMLTVGSVTNAAGRPNNEDAILVKAVSSPNGPESPAYLLAVADGMGGYARGEHASRLAITELEAFDAGDMSQESVALALKQLYRRANDAIFRLSQEAADGQPMGTTLVSAVVLGRNVTIANVGDSRAYLLRANALTQITQDHSYVAEQVSQGLITEQEARRSPQRNLVTHALGIGETLDRRLPGIFELSLLPEDRLLLCSDGFFDVLGPDDYVSTLMAQGPQDSVHGLVEMAITRGTTDNVSAIVVEVSPSLATVQREQIGAELAANTPRMNPILIPAMLFLLLIAAIIIGVLLYL